MSSILNVFNIDNQKSSHVRKANDSQVMSRNCDMEQNGANQEATWPRLKEATVYYFFKNEMNEWM